MTVGDVVTSSDEFFFSSFVLFTKLVIEGVFLVVDSRTVVETIVEDIIIVDEFSLVDEMVVVGGAAVVVVVEVEIVEVLSVGRK